MLNEDSIKRAVEDISENIREGNLKKAQEVFDNLDFECLPKAVRDSVKHAGRLLRRSLKLQQRYALATEPTTPRVQ
jgi:hypothetical protein